jgi:tetrahydromethanopterin S-methyltransferase subunit G
MYDTQFERIASRIDEIETVLAYIHDSARGDRDLVVELEAELATLERRLDQIELVASYDPAFAREEN